MTVPPLALDDDSSIVTLKYSLKDQAYRGGRVKVHNKILHLVHIAHAQ